MAQPNFNVLIKKRENKENYLKYNEKVENKPQARYTIRVMGGIGKVDLKFLGCLQRSWANPELIICNHRNAARNIVAARSCYLISRFEILHEITFTGFSKRQTF